MLTKIIGLPRGVKTGLMLVADAILLPLSLWTAIGLRVDIWHFPQLHAWWVYLLTSIVAIPIFIRLGLYRAVVRYMETRALLMIGVAVTISVWLFAGLLALLTLPSVPRGALLVYWMIAVLYIGASRFLARSLLRSLLPNSRNPYGRRGVAIYGAGSAGCQLAMALRAGREYQPLLFVDDDKALQRLEIMGLRVYEPSQLPTLIERFDVSQVLLAIPSMSRQRRIEIIDQLEPLKVEVRVIPGMADLVDGVVQASDTREIEIDELLGRDIVPPSDSMLDANIRNKCVMVTGAGGSIGSELCRQILRQEPRTLILYEISEYALYLIEAELNAALQKAKFDVEIVPVLGSVQNPVRLRSIMTRYVVQTVYHAAAYKHVPIVEFNMIEGVLNNTFGTHATAQAAIAAGVEAFVLISTDKAVRPTNVMGASKRFAELILQAYASDPTIRTRFCMVRFGNVLGSSGSVVPLFRRQIEAGGPVTVTHPDIIRYFMTIPEAAQLVIQAGAMGASGEVFVLDMGEPVKIVDLARRMIHLSGYSVREDGNPDGDIEIRFSGLRPGEKLYEELLIGDDVSGTRHPKIMMANEMFISRPDLEKELAQLEAACARIDHERVISLLRRCVSGFRPEAEIRDHLYGASGTLHLH
ncbi:polysaccharide biosynthesis protein [Pandoraea cepalis]|uniref:Membrane protein n=1 Tax=Pandoraea cepalis TaxID=2508294 RepID=A0A5E4XFH0_9BURK|nr:nucleoside-diphosphate sugar epimerase/dehydratase [Pandoraea cepalis]VVE34925.1 membrane protein [Pandoraea cepalis]